MSVKVAIGKSQQKDIGDAAQETVSACLRQLPAKSAHLAIVFTTPHYASAGMLKNIKLNLAANTPLIGCSGTHIITSEGTDDEGIVLALLSLPEIKISCGAMNLARGKDPSLAGQELGTRLLSNVKGLRRETCLLLNDGLSENTSGLLQGLQNILGKSFPFIGGGSSDNFKFKQTYQYLNEEVLHKSAVAALLCGKLNYGIGIRHGWKPLGKIRTITQSSANVIKMIDGKKASSLYEDYFGKSLPQLRKEILYINILYPLGIYLAGEDEYLLRNVISLAEDGSIIAQGDVPQGSSIRLMIGTKESALAAARQAAQQVKTALRDKKIALALVISSASRAHLLGRRIGAEINAVKEILGHNSPVAGFYSYGEYAPLGSTNYYGQTYLHNQAIALLGIGE